MEDIDKQDVIRSWCQLVQHYETDVNRNVRIKKLESVINIVFHHNYGGGLVKCIQDYEDAFTELALLVQNTWNDNEINKIYWHALLVYVVLQCSFNSIGNFPAKK
jgi:hypothetical protein